MKTFTFLLALAATLIFSSCGSNDEATKDQANSKAELYEQVTKLLTTVTDETTATAATSQLAEIQKELTLVDTQSKTLQISAEQKEALKVVTDEAVEKMLQACDQAATRISKDDKASAILNAAIDQLFATLESFEE